MLKNPEVKLQGKPSKGYLFPKYPGKFFIQAQKQIENKSLPQFSPTKFKKLQNNNKPFDDSQYKNMKAQAQYIKKIHQVKKRLQTQIKKYNQQRKDHQHLPKKLSLSLEPRNNTIKLEQICVNIRREQQKKALDNPQFNMSLKKQKIKRKQTIKYLLKNKSWMRKNLRTEELSFLKEHKKSVSDGINYIKSQSKQDLIQQKKQMKLPSIDRHYNYSQGRYSPVNQASIRYSFPNTPYLSDQKPYHSLNSAQYCQSNRSASNQSKIKKLKIQLQGSTKSLQKRFQSKKKFMLDHKQMVVQQQIFLKGWDSIHERHSHEQDSFQQGIY